jgi:hypothetical protein
MENQLEKVFVKVNQRWQKATIINEEEGKVNVLTQDGQRFSIDKESKWLELVQNPAQRYAYGDVKEQLEGQYISFEKLPENVKDNLVQGKEHFHVSTYLSDGELKETSKMVQMVYDPNMGSRLFVQFKRKNQVTLDQAMAYNHKFSPNEFERMVSKKEVVLFQGITKDGELFEKLAYYEAKLLDIRTKSALTPNTYLYGSKLSATQAKALNQGEEIEIKIKTKSKGTKPYLVSYTPRNEIFITKNLQIEKARNLEIVTDEKKKSSSQRMKI